MPKPIKAILADIDGTLIEGGDLDKFNPGLKALIREMRKEGILFALSSGRCFQEQYAFFRKLIAPGQPHQNEGILYEEGALRLFGQTGEIGDPIILGGLAPDQVKEINAFAEKNSLYAGLAPQANSELYETIIGYVTPAFVSQGKTDLGLLTGKHLQIKEALEKQFPWVEVTKSADAVDIKARGVSKAKQVQVYSEKTGIPLEQMAYFGDSGNDLPAMREIGNARGLVVYVGNDSEQEEVVKGFPYSWVPCSKGVPGTLLCLYHLFGDYFSRKAKLSEAE